MGNFSTPFDNEFFDINEALKPSCSAGRQSRTYSMLYVYNYVMDYNYWYNFAFDTYTSKYSSGTMYTTDYCFTHGERIDESNNGYFTGNCKYGLGIYGSHIVYLNPETNREEMGHPNSEFEKELGEIYSNTSFCIMSSLIPKGNNNYKIFSSIPHPMCYQINCSDTSLTIKINNEFIVCPKEGGNVKVEGYDGFLHCPDYNLICTGTKVCNDIFDCIQQKSLYKETTFNYDFTPKTTQRFSQISSMPIIQENNYEISENGFCPLYCIQCDINKKCKKCKDGYNMIGIKPEDNESVICDNTIDIKNIEYYSYENIYYKCNEECNGCTFANLCVSCKDNYYPLVDKNYCYKKEENISGYYFNQALKQFDSCHIN